MSVKPEWNVIGVFATEQDAQQLNFAYTVGLDAKDLPELFVIGPVGLQAMGSMLNTVAARMVETGVIPQGDVDLQMTLATTGADLRGSVKTPSNAGLADLLENYVLQTARGTQPLVLQLVWADNQNLLPWEPDYNHAVYHQPIF